MVPATTGPAGVQGEGVFRIGAVLACRQDFIERQAVWRDDEIANPMSGQELGSNRHSDGNCEHDPIEQVNSGSPIGVEKEQAIWPACVLIVPYERDQKPGNDVEGLHRQQAAERDVIGNFADMTSTTANASSKRITPNRNLLIEVKKRCAASGTRIVALQCRTTNTEHLA
jgi:hypothetical protein